VVQGLGEHLYSNVHDAEYDFGQVSGFDPLDVAGADGKNEIRRGRTCEVLSKGLELEKATRLEN